MVLSTDPVETYCGRAPLRLDRDCDFGVVRTDAEKVCIKCLKAFAKEDGEVEYEVEFEGCSTA